MKILKWSKYITFDPYDEKVSFCVKTEEEVLKELENYSHIKINVWNKKIKLASIHRCKKEEFVIEKRLFSKDDFIQLLNCINNYYKK